jgi:broad specificity phosphatase PhoE
MQEDNQKTKFIITLLRHGESVGNANGYHQGQSDFPLTEKGRRQAQALAQRWKKEALSFDKIISSPLARARQTAQILASSLGTALEYNSDWMERNNGVLDGVKAEEAAVRYPRPGFIHPFQRIGFSGESQWELYLRAGRAVQGLLHRKPGSYLVVSHGGLLNMVLYVALSIVPQANFQGPRFRFQNTAFARLKYTPGQHDWLVERLNDRLHWPEKLNGSEAETI